MTTPTLNKLLEICHRSGPDPYDEGMRLAAEAMRLLVHPAIQCRSA